MIGQSLEPLRKTAKTKEPFFAFCLMFSIANDLSCFYIVFVFFLSYHEDFFVCFIPRIITISTLIYKRSDMAIFSVVGPNRSMYVKIY